jgi:hypothetical protein
MNRRRFKAFSILSIVGFLKTFGLIKAKEYDESSKFKLDAVSFFYKESTDNKMDTVDSMVLSISSNNAFDSSNDVSILMSCSATYDDINDRSNLEYYGNSKSSVIHGNSNKILTVVCKSKEKSQKIKPPTIGITSVKIGINGSTGEVVIPPNKFDPIRPSPSLPC